MFGLLGFIIAIVITLVIAALILGSEFDIIDTSKIPLASIIVDFFEDKVADIIDGIGVPDWAKLTILFGGIFFITWMFWFAMVVAIALVLIFHKK